MIDDCIAPDVTSYAVGGDTVVGSGQGTELRSELGIAKFNLPAFNEFGKRLNAQCLTMCAPLCTC